MSHPKIKTVKIERAGKKEKPRTLRLTKNIKTKVCVGNMYQHRQENDVVQPCIINNAYPNYKEFLNSNLVLILEPTTNQLLGLQTHASCQEALNELQPCYGWEKERVLFFLLLLFPSFIKAIIPGFDQRSNKICSTRLE